MSARSVLLGAIEILSTAGWCQFKSHDEDGRCCATGAIDATMSNYLDLLKAESALRKAIGTSNIPLWNDRPGRTKEEVIFAFKKAVDLCE